MTKQGTSLRDIPVDADRDGRSHHAVWNADGEFSVTVPDDGDYVLSAYFAEEDCWVQYSTSGPTTVWDEATLITVADADVTDIEFVVPTDPASLCR